MSQEARKYIAKNVNKYRIIKGLTKEELSLILGFDNSYISKLERKNVNITIDKLEQIANVLNVKIVKLLDEN